MQPLNQLPGETLRDMAEAGLQILECYRLLGKSDDNIVGEVIKGQGMFYEFDHYPKGDVYDRETHSQYYYHAHRDGEHGHFHTFLRERAIPERCRPAEQSHADFMDEREDRVSHLIAISMNPPGFPIALFTTNRWVTADTWYPANDVIRMLDCFFIDMAYPSLPVNLWLHAMLRLFRPQIEDLILQRDKAISKWAEEHADQDVFEDRALDITSTRRISVERQIARVNKALDALH